MIPENCKRKVIQTLKSRLKPDFILLFGSYAAGAAREASDLDIAYYSETTLTNYERFLLAGDLSEACNMEVDLIDIKQVDTVFAAQIFSTGELLECVDENVFFKERMKALSMYVALNEQRTDILRGIEERGNIYGSQ